MPECSALGFQMWKVAFVAWDYAYDLMVFPTKKKFNTRGMWKNQVDLTNKYTHRNKQNIFSTPTTFKKKKR